MSRTVLQDDDARQYNDILTRLKRLEQRIGSVHDVAAGATSLDLGSFDGEDIMGVKISGSLLTAGGPGVFYLKPNGLSTISENHISDQIQSGLISPYTPADVPGTDGAATNKAGMLIAQASAYNVAALAVNFTTLFCTRTGTVRMSHGFYLCTDRTTDGNRLILTMINSCWHDASTAVESLSIVMSAGTFSGRVLVETI